MGERYNTTLPQPQMTQQELDVWKLAVQGMTQLRIAEELGVHQSTVSRVLHRITNRSLAVMDDFVQTEKVLHINILRYLADEAIQGYRASCEPEKKLHKARHDKLITLGVKRDANGQPVHKEDGSPEYEFALEGATETMGSSIQHRPGDARFLETARLCLKDIQHILGITELRVRVDWRSKVPEGVDPDTLAAMFADLMLMGQDGPVTETE